MEAFLEKLEHWRHINWFVFLWSFILGILLVSFVAISPLVSIFICILALGVIVGEKILYEKVSKAIFLFCLALFAFSLGVLRFDIKDFHEPETPSTTGIVSSEPEHRDSDVRFVFTSDNNQKVLVTTNVFSSVQYGDRVEVLGKLKVPGIIDDASGGKSFDYGAYLSKDDIYYTESFARVNIISYGHGNKIIAWLLKIKNAFALKMKQILPEPESSLLAGLTISGKQALPKSVVSDFTNAGVVQVIVLSGYNVTIIAEFFLLIFSFLGIRLATGASAVGIVLFTLMTGASATVVRASIMVLVFLFGKIIGRQASTSRLLLFTAFLMLMQNPKILVFDPSFDLTFIAMLALVYGVPVAEKYLQKIPKKFGARTLVATTLATQIAVFPYLLYNVGAVSVVSLFSNALIIFVVPLTMLVGFLATFLAFVSTIIAWPLSFVSHLLLLWILSVAHFFGNLSFSLIKISHFSVWLTLLSYAGLVFIVWRSRSSVQRLSS